MSSLYPPHTFLKIDSEIYDTEMYELVLKVGNIKQEDIDIEMRRDIITISYHPAARIDTSCKIMKQSFSRQFKITEDMKVGRVTYLDGELRIIFTKTIPKASQVVKIEISSQKEFLTE